MEEAKQDLSRVWIDEPKSLFQFLDSYKDLESRVVANLQEQKLLDLPNQARARIGLSRFAVNQSPTRGFSVNRFHNTL